MKERIRMIICTIMTMVIGYFVFANLFHIVTLQQKESYDFNNVREIEQMKRETTILENNLKKLNTITETQHLNAEEYADIKGKLVWIDEVVKKTQLLSLSGVKNYTDRELMEWILETKDLRALDMAGAYRKVTDRDSESGFDIEQITSSYMDSLLAQSLVNQSLTDNYRYHYEIGNSMNRISTRIWSTLSSTTKNLELARNLSDYLVRDGEVDA